MSTAVSADRLADLILRLLDVSPDLLKANQRHEDDQDEPVLGVLVTASGPEHESQAVHAVAVADEAFGGGKRVDVGSVSRREGDLLALRQT
ncbi:hypothetical protein [Streptomyces xanthophaeus]|uniref:hypothetical protein n=1 Tax=Streptomyces xanthophaeus TaxID=67385 RepID=UPI003724C30E